MGLAHCNRHPAMEAEFRCVQCSKPCCVKCVVNERFCSDACNQKYATFYKNYRKPGDTSRSPLLALVFFIAIVAGLYMLAKHFRYLPW